MNHLTGRTTPTDPVGPPPRRLLYDMTFTCVSGKMSGIERVVRSWYQAGQTLQSPTSEIEFVPVFAAGDRFYHYDAHAQAVLQAVANFERDCLAASSAAYRQVTAALCACFPLSSVKRCLQPPAGHLGLLKGWHRRWKRSIHAQAASGQTPLTVTASDILWLPDAYWAQPSVWPAVARARSQGAYVASLVYDLIPLRDGATHSGFEAYLNQVLAHSESILCISDCERKHLQEFMARARVRQTTLEPDLYTIILGCEVSDAQGDVRPELKNVYASESRDGVFLCVNTFDPRKNHAYLLDAFEQLWLSGSDCRLCLVGRVGWQCSQLLNRIAHHVELNRRLFVIHDASDHEVAFCYRSARAVITASKDEGFGLPVVEGLARGCHTLASDIPIHREIGGGAASYFDLADPGSLVATVRHLLLTTSPAQPCPGQARPGQALLSQSLPGQALLEPGPGQPLLSPSPCSGQTLQPPSLQPVRPKAICDDIYPTPPPKLMSWQDSFERCWEHLQAAYLRRKPVPLPPGHPSSKTGHPSSKTGIASSFA